MVHRLSTLQAMAGSVDLGSHYVGCGVADMVLIKSAARRNSLSVVVLAVTGLIISGVYLALTSNPLPLAGYFLVALCIAGIIAGAAKYQEPEVVLEIHPQGVVYQHRYGRWQIPWEDIQRIDRPRVHHGLEHQALSYLGFKLKHPDRFAQQVPPRLASKLLMQQRALLLFCDEQGCATGQCYAENLIESDAYRLSDGKKLTGLRAMFASRMQRLRAALGYDVFIDINEFDRPVEEVVTLLREYQHNPSRLV